jgi:aminopeptidase YwaD
MLGLAVVQLARGEALGTVGWILIGFPIAPSIVVGLFFTRGRHGAGNVPGAVDNLAASAIAVALCRFLVEHPDDIPRDTEIRFVSFGSEEAGTRGSRRYVERHRDELVRLDARLLNLEMVADPTITIFTSDMNRSVQHSPEAVQSAVAAAEAARVPYRLAPAGMGVGTDAGPFSRAGIKAVTLFPFRMPDQLVAFYHQKWDRPDVLTIPPLENALKLALAWVRSGGAVDGSWNTGSCQ